MPIGIFLWIIGWCLYRIGAVKRSHSTGNNKNLRKAALHVSEREVEPIVLGAAR
jgi:hypothetical protein